MPLGLDALAAVDCVRVCASWLLVAREAQATMPPAQKEKSLFEEYTQAK